MIDRTAREQVISAFEAYLDDQITAFEFDDRLQEIAREDRTVHEVIRTAWFHYDDCKDHKVYLSKQQWDYFQRLLLILRSDAELSSSHSRRWSWDHLVAWLALAAFVGIASIVGWGGHLMLWAIPFGGISIPIGIYRYRRVSDLMPREIACVPFDSVSEIRCLRRQLPGFKKRRYRTDIGDRKIRTKAEDSFNWVCFYCFWFAVAPLALFFQGFPSIDAHTQKLAKP